MLVDALLCGCVAQIRGVRRLSAELLPKRQTVAKLAVACNREACRTEAHSPPDGTCLADLCLMSVYARPPAGAYLPQQTYALPAQQPPPSDVRPPGCAPASSSHSPNFTLPPGVPLQANPRDLIAELCQIIQRQSQEILAMRQERFQERGQATGFVEGG